LETFSNTYQHSIATLGVIGTLFAAGATFAAVVVSLYLARRSETVRLKASFRVALFSVNNISHTVQYATLTISNIGIRPAWLPILFFEWRIPFCKKRQPETMANWVNMAYSNNQQREILVGRATIIRLGNMDEFRTVMAKELHNMHKKLRWCKKIRLRRLHATIYTDDDNACAVTFSRPMRDELKRLIKRLPKHIG
jgi:hypothetical protein